MNGPATASAPNPEYSKSPHLICGSKLRAVGAVLVCAYFVYASYIPIRDDEFQAKHELWSTITWLVWLLLMAGIIPETRCWRERALFGLVLANCAVGLTLSAWSSIPFPMLRNARELSLVLWVLSSLMALTMLRKLPESLPPKPAAKSEEPL